MADSAPEAPADAPAPAKSTQRFRRAHTGPRQSPDAVARQGRIAQLAWASFNDRDTSMAFLNDHNDALGARPLDLAAASEAGYQAVERAIELRAADR